MTNPDGDAPRIDSRERLTAERRAFEAYLNEGPLPQSTQSYATLYRRLDLAEQALEQKTNALLAQSHALTQQHKPGSPLRQQQHDLTMGLLDLHEAARRIANHARHASTLDLLDRVDAHRNAVRHRAPESAPIQQRDYVQSLKARSALRTLPQPVAEPAQTPARHSETQSSLLGDKAMSTEKRPTLTVRHLYGGFKTFKTERAREAALDQNTQPASLHDRLRAAAKARQTAEPVQRDQEREQER